MEHTEPSTDSRMDDAIDWRRFAIIAAVLIVTTLVLYLAVHTWLSKYKRRHAQPVLPRAIRLPVVVQRHSPAADTAPTTAAPVPFSLPSRAAWRDSASTSRSHDPPPAYEEADRSARVGGSTTVPASTHTRLPSPSISIGENNNQVFVPNSVHRPGFRRATHYVQPIIRPEVHDSQASVDNLPPYDDPPSHKPVDSPLQSVQVTHQQRPFSNLPHPLITAPSGAHTRPGAETRHPTYDQLYDLLQARVLQARVYR